MLLGALGIYIATGVLGALGGLGGFFLPNLLGVVKASTGSFAGGFLVLAGFALGSWVLLRLLAAVHTGWRVSWRAQPPTGRRGEPAPELSYQD